MPRWDEVQKMMREAQTPQDKADAARALRDHIKTDHAEHLGKHIVCQCKGSKNNVVNLGNLPDAMQNPEVYDKIKRAVVKK